MASAEYVINPDRIQTFFTELETRKTLLASITDLHKTLTTHFTSLSQTLAQKTQALDSQIESFNSLSKKSLESLENRQNAIPERESAAAARIEEQKALAVLDLESSDDNVGERKKDLAEVLKMYFRRMHASGLMRLMLAKRKESVALREEIAAAVDEAVDPLGLVLEAVEEFVGMKIEGKVGMADRRWACSLLIQVVVPLPMQGGSSEILVARSLKERAFRVLEKWKGVLGGGEGSGGVGAGEASMFLQMVIGFGLKEKLEEEFLRKLVLEFAGRRDMAKLAVALGFVGDKMGGKGWLKLLFL